MNHFFILGSHPALSVAELTSRFSIKKPLRLGEVLIGDCAIGDPTEAIRTLGGTIKIGRLIGRVTPSGLYDVLVTELLAAEKSGKFNFGISVYGKSSLNTHKLGLELKTALKAEGVSCRFVTSREKTLSSVVVEQNKLVAGGRELVVIVDNGQAHVGVTESVQPFKQLSRRDYGRPARDDHSGMLPPKLAQIMINLSGCPLDGALLDPFCGSGTVLTEAMLMGYRSIFGSDLSAKAVDDSKENIEWTKKESGLSVTPKVRQSDARQLSRIYAPGTIEAVVGETYLGPQRGAVNIKKTAVELSTLYGLVLKEIARVLRPGGRAVLALPAFVEGRRRHLLPLSFSSLSLLKPPAGPATEGISERGTFLYGRPGQRVWREIIVVKK